MGRGRQSGHDRKEERKQKRADAKDAKYEKTARKVTKGALNKEIRAKKAVAESFKMASSINMDRKEENTLLELIAMLDNVTIAPQQVQFNDHQKVRVYTPDETERADNNDSEGSESESESGSDNEVESEQASATDNENSESVIESTADGAPTEDRDSDASADGSGDSSDTDSNSDDSTNDSGASGDESDEDSVKSRTEHASTAITHTAPGEKVVIGRQKFIRQLIRDERRYVRAQQQAQLLAPSAERVAARLKQSLQSNAMLNTSTAYQTTTQNVSANNGIVRTVSTPVSSTSDIGFAYKPHKDKNATAVTTPIRPVLSSTVRISAHFDKSGDGRSKTGAAKLIVLPRTTSVPELTEILRVKFKATATVVDNAGAKKPKFDLVRVDSTGEIVYGFTLSTLADGEALVLFCSKNDSTYVKPTVETITAAVTAARVAARVAAGTNVASAIDSDVATPTAEATEELSQSQDTTTPADDQATFENTHNTANAADVPATSSTNTHTDANQTDTAGTPGASPAPPYWTPPLQDTSREYPVPHNVHSEAEVAAQNAQIRAQLTDAYKHVNYTPIREQRKSLPIFSMKNDILEAVAQNPVVVVSGETGSGKTTQLPLYLLESMIKNEGASECNIICTQPRRIAAISVAERVHYECAQPGQVGTGLIGYQVRLDSRVCSKTKLTYCTTGVLLRRLQDPRCLSTISHIILDEVHERGVETDFLMTLLKQQAPNYPNLRLILMSATMQEGMFSEYFAQCPVIYVSGRTFPVHQHYMQDIHTLVAQGQHMLATERGKVSNYSYSKAGNRGNSASSTAGDDNIVHGYDAMSGENRNSSKGGYKGKHPRLDKDDPTVLSQKAPKFDADLTAELVIRIIATHSARTTSSSSKHSGTPHNTDKLVPFPVPPGVRQSHTVPAAATTAMSAQDTPSKVLTNRLGSIQRAAAKIRENSATKATTATQSSTNAAVGEDGGKVNATLSAQDSRAGASTASTEKQDASVIEARGDAILVFLSGIQSIEKVNKALRQRGVLQSLNAQVYILHGSQSPEQQRRVFRRTAPGEWKIVLATNIAETSITVDDVTHVVDSGYVKEMCFDPAGGFSSLQEVFVSRAAARQRAGRAGRVRAGHCWRMYSEEYFNHPTRVDEHPLPEIQRVPLEEVVLQVLLLKLGSPEHFLGQCLQPPSREQIRASLACLIEIRALLPLSELPLTALGYHLARMPVDVRIGKMLIYASLLQCVEPVLTIAAALGGKSPFVTPQDQKGDSLLSHQRFLLSHHHSHSASDQHSADPNLAQAEVMDTPVKGAFYQHKHFSPSSTSTPVTIVDTKIKKSTATTSSTSSTASTENMTVENCYSDHLALVNAYDQWQAVYAKHGADAAWRFCKERFLSFNVLNDMRALREHFRAYLSHTGFINLHNSALSEAEGAELDAELLPEVLQRTDNADTHMDSRTIEALVKCVLCAGLYPNIVRLGRFKETKSPSKSSNRRAVGDTVETIKLVQSDLSEVSLHPSCLINSYTRAILDSKKEEEQQRQSGAGAGAGAAVSPSKRSHYGLRTDTATKDAFIAYYKKMSLNKLFLFDGTVVPHAAVLLFSNSDIVWSKGRDRVTVGGWIEMKITELHCILYRRLQREIEDLLRSKVEDPAVDITARQRNLTYIVQLLVT